MYYFLYKSFLQTVNIRISDKYFAALKKSLNHNVFRITNKKVIYARCYLLIVWQFSVTEIVGSDLLTTAISTLGCK